MQFDRLKRREFIAHLDKLFFGRQAMDVSQHFNGIFMLIVRIFSAVYSNLGSAKQH